VRRDGDTISFRLRLTPKGGRDAIEGWSEGADGRAHLKARVAVAPKGGKANERLIALLAKTLGVAKSTVRIRTGQTARLKTIEISCAVSGVAARLEAMEIVK
jgi:uncharacterized protein (TIGR00251 family)